jgi:prepilin-type N-terminal cleavage/methylation domain-containing protein
VVVRRAPEQGMTLVELMVTMVIASIVAASTFMFFAGQQRVYETQTKMLNVQQNAWAAMEVLTRFVRAAGSGMYGCVRPVGGIVAAPPLKRTPATTNPDDSDNPPVIAGGDLSQHPNAGLRAYNVATGQVQRIPPLWIVDQVDSSKAANNGIVSQTDVLTVALGNRTSGTTFDSPLAGGGVTKTTDAIVLPAGNWQMFQANEFMVLVGEPGMGGAASDIGCTLLQVTNSNQANNTLEHATNTWNPGSIVAGMIPGSYGYGAYTPDTNLNTGVRNFGEFWWVRFSVVIANSATDKYANLTNLGIPVLIMERLDGTTTTGPQVLAEGIEDLQVAFACDLDANGSLTEGSPSKAADEWTLNDPNDVIALNRGAKCNQPSAVRLTLVARSLTEDNGIDAKLNVNGRPAIENHLNACCSTSNTTCCDQYRRRVMSTTVYPRNN